MVKVGNDAFLANKTLGSVRFPRSLKYIGRYAFNSCALASIDLSFTRLEAVAFGAFAFNRPLAAVSMAPTLRKVDREAFSNCPALATVTVPTGADVGDEAFPLHTRIQRTSPETIRQEALVWL